MLPFSCINAVGWSCVRQNGVAMWCHIVSHCVYVCYFIGCICVSHAKRRILNISTNKFRNAVARSKWRFWIIYCSYSFIYITYCRIFIVAQPFERRPLKYCVYARARTRTVLNVLRVIRASICISSDFTWIDVKWFSHIHVVIVGWVKERICEDNWPDVFMDALNQQKNTYTLLRQ